MLTRSLTVTTLALLLLACGGVDLGGPPRDLEQAVDWCEQVDARGCLWLARRYERDPSLIEKEPRAYATYARVSCEQGMVAMCWDVGEQLLHGKGVPRDLPAAARFIGMACDAGMPQACYTLGVQHRRGDGVERDAQRAHELFRKSCDDGFFQGCANAGQMHTTDELGPPDWSLARPFYARACELGQVEELCRAAQE